MYINDGKLHKLTAVILSPDIDDHTVISIHDSDGRMVARGNWMEDHILEQSSKWGKATGDRERVNFRMV